MHMNIRILFKTYPTLIGNHSFYSSHIMHSVIIITISKPAPSVVSQPKFHYTSLLFFLHNRVEFAANLIHIIDI